MDGAFIAIGHEPQSEIVEGIVDLDDDGYVRHRGQLDAHERRRASSPPATSSTTPTARRSPPPARAARPALDAEWYLRDNPAVPTPAALEGTGDLAEAQWAPASAQPDRERGSRASSVARVGLHARRRRSTCASRPSVAQRDRARSRVPVLARAAQRAAPQRAVAAARGRARRRERRVADRARAVIVHPRARRTRMR